MTQPAGDLLLKILNYFEAMLNTFEFFHVKEVVQSWLVYGNNLSWIIQYVSWERQWNKVSASFFFWCFRTLMKEKQILAL